MNLQTLTAGLRNGWQAAWGRRSPREQLLLGIGVWVLGLATLWVLALGPALVGRGGAWWPLPLMPRLSAFWA